MFIQGLVLMVAGVSIVFLFLGLLIGVMTVSSKIIPRFNHILPDEEPKVKAKKARREHAPKQDASNDDEIVIAIAAAVAHQRNLS